MTEEYEELKSKYDTISLPENQRNVWKNHTLLPLIRQALNKASYELFGVLIKMDLTSSELRDIEESIHKYRDKLIEDISAISYSLRKEDKVVTDSRDKKLSES